MVFRRFFDFDHGCAAYAFGCGGQGLCAVVDAREPEIGDYVAFVSSRRMRITHVIDTHVHADHRSGGPELAERVGAPYCLHASADVRRPFTPLEDEAELELGNTRIRVLHTPGHTPESLSLVVTDLRRGPAPWFVITGDTLFSGALSGKPSSTIGFEKRFNRALSLGRDAFVDAVAVVAPTPADADLILEFNRGHSDR